jgi:hypothetical protein
MFGSSNGELSAARFRSRNGNVSLGWHAWTNPADGRRAWSTSESATFIGFGYGSFFTVVPKWFIVALSAAVAAAPWIQCSKRFSLRALLIATTLVAVGLGILVIST